MPMSREDSLKLLAIFFSKYDQKTRKKLMLVIKDLKQLANAQEMEMSEIKKAFRKLETYEEGLKKYEDPKSTPEEKTKALEDIASIGSDVDSLWSTHKKFSDFLFSVAIICAKVKSILDIEKVSIPESEPKARKS